MASFRARISPILVLVIISVCHGDEEQSIHCAYTGNPHLNERHNGSDSLPRVNTENLAESGVVLPDNRTMRCREKRDFCYTFWSVDPSNRTGPIVLIQGCWDHPDPKECLSEGGCVAHRAPNKAVNNTRFCCCRGNMCNLNITDNYVPGLDDIAQAVATRRDSRFDPNYKTKTIVIALSSVFSVALVIVIAYLVYRLRYMHNNESLDPLFLGEDPSTPSFEVDELKLDELLVKGRFGEVWKGTLDDIEVAVKVYNTGQRQYYINERDIYKMDFMDHDSLPRYYGADERLCEGSQNQYVIVMSYISDGTLTNYLKHNSLDWSTLCRMCHSIASGLAHLHTDMSKGDKNKPAIAHRDFNTRNILVKPDLSCCICDFGFAMKIMGGKYIRNGHEENAEQASLSDVGTLRYMAPEVLEGAVNLRDCESSLKQIDIYALGLVFWEVGTRCSDLFQGLPVPEYQLPFQAEVGIHPSFEEMQDIVKKARPLFPDLWKDTNQAIRAFKETIEDCWDQDAEARLTALCVEERVMEMTTLWETRHKGVTPTMNTSCLGALEEKGVIQRNPTSSSQIVDVVSAPVEGVNPSSQVVSNQVTGGNEANRPSARISYSENSVSAASTVETVLSPSESGDPVPVPAPVPNKDNRNAMFERNSQAFKPHQGQNPTVERNTHKRSDEELAVLGNSLVDKAVKEAAGSSLDRDNVTHAANNSTLTDELLDAIADNLESSLVQNDILNHQQRGSAKPYVLNQFNLSEPLAVRRKQHNVPGNGSVNHNLNRAPSNLNTDVKPKLPFGKGKKKQSKENKDKGSKLKSLFSKGFLSKGGNNFDVESGSRDSPEPGVSGASGGAGYSPYETKIPNTEVEARPVSTEVMIVNGQPVVRPTSLALGRSNGDPNRTAGGDAAAGASGHSQQQNLLGMAEVGVAKLQPAPVHSGQPVYIKQKSHSNVDLSPTATQMVVDIQPYTRPRSINSIPNVINAPTRNMLHNDTRPSNIHAARVGSQSPQKNEHFSWCSENLTSSNPSNGSIPPENSDNPQSAFSLQQFSNVDSDTSATQAADYRC